MMIDFSHLRLLVYTLTLAFVAGCTHTPTSAENTGSFSGQPSADMESARVHTELASEYLRMRQYDVALEEYTIATQRSPNYGLAYNGLGLVYSALGETSKAEAAFQRALQLQPNSSESHNNYGRFLCDLGKYEAANNEFMLATKNPLYKTPQMAFHNAGVCAVRSQQKAKAEGYFIKALELDPEYHASAYQLALLQFAKGDAALAWKTLQNAVNLAPAPENLLLAIRIARQLGLREDSQYYSEQLQKLFPNSNEYRQLLKME